MSAGRDARLRRVVRDILEFRRRLFAGWAVDDDESDTPDELERSLRYAAEEEDERREFRRFPCLIDAELQLVSAGDEEESDDAIVQEISAGGAKITTNRAIARGTNVRLRLPAPWGEGTSTVLAGRVAWSRDGHQGIQFMGAPVPAEQQADGTEGSGAQGTS